MATILSLLGIAVGFFCGYVIGSGKSRWENKGDERQDKLIVAVVISVAVIVAYRYPIVHELWSK